MIKILLLLSVLFITISCGNSWETFEGAITGKKKITTDEYLIKKKDPLILPPDYKNLPLPDSNKNTNSTDSNRIKSILNENASSEDSKKRKSPLETSIQEELRKNN